MLNKVLMVSGALEDDGNPGYTQPFVDRQIESLKSMGIDIITFSIKGWQSKYNYYKSIHLINDIIRNDKEISIIHAHYSYSGIISSFQNKVPVVVSLMGDDVFGTSKENGDIKFITKTNIYLVRLFMKRWSAVIVKSKLMAQKINHPNLYIIPNGVDFNLFKPIDKNEAREFLGWCKDGNYILFGGNPDNMGKNFKLAKQVVDILTGKGMNVNIIPIKNIPHHQIPYYLNACDCLLFTSFKEGSPNIVKESLACNLPIVSVNVGDVEERIFGLSDCYISKFDPTELAGYVKLILEKKPRPNLRDTIKNLELSIVAQKICKIYEGVLK